MLMLAALILFVALPAVGLVAKTATSHFGCARSAFQQSVTQACKP